MTTRPIRLLVSREHAEQILSWYETCQQRPTPTRTQQQRTEQIRSLRAQGMTNQEIGDKLGLTKQAVSSWNKRHK